MFTPNMKCQIAKSSGRNLYGEDGHGEPFDERCAIVELKAAATVTNARSQLSGSQTAAEDLEITASVMLQSTTKAKLGDLLLVAGQRLRIMSVVPQFTTMGKLDHFLVGGTPWV